MIFQKRLFLIVSFFLISGAIPSYSSEDKGDGILKAPPELTDEDPTKGEIADIYIDVRVPVNRDYRYYNRGYYRREYPFYYVDDPYYYYGPGYFSFYGHYEDDDDDCRHHHHKRCHDHH